jgi:hypothetical protein
MLAAPGFLTIAAFRDLTAHRVREQLAHYVGGKVLRFELPLLPALQFVCTGIREGGVTTSLALDTHGKSLSSRLLDGVARLVA